MVQRAFLKQKRILIVVYPLIDYKLLFNGLFMLEEVRNDELLWIDRIYEYRECHQHKKHKSAFYLSLSKVFDKQTELHEDEAK